MEPPARKKTGPLMKAVTATRMRDMALGALGAMIGAWAAPFGSAMLGALAGVLASGGLRLAMPKGNWLGEGERLAARPHKRDRPQEREQAVLESLPLAFLMLDEGAQVTFCSTDAHALLVRDPVGQHISAVFRAPAVLAAVNRSLSGETRDETFEFTALRPRTRHLRATIRVPGREKRVVLALQDVSQVHRLDAMRMDFVANASHELRTPLAAISGMVETLQGPARNDTANRDRFLGIITREVARMARLVDDLLSLSRIELQANVTPTAQEDLRPIVAEAVGATASLAAENGNDIHVDLGEGALIVRGDRDELLQIFHNLISNAIKYGGADQPIEILRKAQPEGWIGIAVRDHGEGIDPTLVPRLTERFFRVNKRESISRGGTGLGLAIVKHILTRHRGELQITSTVGEGSSFTVRLPTP